MIVEQWGDGERAVLVHGSLATGPAEWETQRPLPSEGYRLVVPTRSPYVTRDRGEDFLKDAEEIAELLEDGAHLVGHSYGALGAIAAAELKPHAVRSLVLAEPPLFDITDDADARRLEEKIREILPVQDNRVFLERFLSAVGTSIVEIEEADVEELVSMVPILRSARQPWDSPPALDHLMENRIPVTVVSGDHHPGFTAICRALADAVGGSLRSVRGAGHEVQFAEGFNDLLLEAWASAPAA